MKRLILSLLLIAGFAYGQDSITPASGGGMFTKITYDWTSDGSGNATGITSTAVPGLTYKAITSPGSATPTDNYDIVLQQVFTDRTGADVTVGTDFADSLMLNRDNASTEEINLWPNDSAHVAGRLKFSITNAGASKTGRLEFWVWQTLADGEFTVNVDAIETPTGTGTDNRIVRWDTTTDLQDSDFQLADNGDLSDQVGDLTVADNFVVTGTSALNGAVTVGTSTLASTINLNIRAAANQNKAIRFQSGTLDRWVFFSTSSTESGSNAGSPLTLSAFDDAGSLIDVVFTITRASGGTASWARPILMQDNISTRYGTDGDIRVEYDETTDDRLEWHDGTNLLQWLTDAGTTGNAGVTGTFQLLDDKNLLFGTDSDIRVGYDETTDDRLEWSDGSNLLMALADAGTTGNVTFTGNITDTNTSATHTLYGTTTFRNTSFNPIAIDRQINANGAGVGPRWTLLDSDNNAHEYGYIGTVITSNTNGAETGQIQIHAASAAAASSTTAAATFFSTGNQTLRGALTAGSGAIVVTNSTGNLATTAPAGTAATTKILGSNGTAVAWQTPKTKAFVLGARSGEVTASNGATAPAKVSEAGGREYYHIAYADASTQYAQWEFILPEDYDGGAVAFKVYWTCTTGHTGSSTVRWQVEGLSATDDEVTNQSYGTAAAVDDDSTANADTMVSASTALTIGGSPAAGHLVNFQVARLGGHANDDLAASVRLLGVKVEYTPLPY